MFNTTILLRNISYNLIIIKEIGLKRKEKNGNRCKGSPVEAIGPTGSLSGYTYNPKSKICTTYYYEGSGVTKNSYQSKKECEAQCSKFFYIS